MKQKTNRKINQNSKDGGGCFAFNIQTCHFQRRWFAHMGEGLKKEGARSVGRIKVTKGLARTLGYFAASLVSVDAVERLEGPRGHCV